MSEKISSCFGLPFLFLSECPCIAIGNEYNIRVARKNKTMTKSEIRTIKTRIASLKEELTDTICQRFEAARMTVQGEIRRNERLLTHGYPA